MSRNIKVAAVALALAGGVYLGGAAPAGASNMGFKLERSFDLVRNGSGRALQSKYWVSFPLFNGLGDVGNATATTGSKCVGDTNGPAAGDGTVDSLDAICDMWTARLTPATAGAFVFRYWDSATCSYVTQSANLNRLNGNMVVTPAFPLIPQIGYEIVIGVQATDTFSPTNRAVIVGSHDPSFAGLPLTYSTTCGARAARQAIINLPYHTMYRTSFDILCGLENVDWFDNLPAGGDGKPDACWDDLDGDQAFDVGEPLTGIYDGDTTVSVAMFDPSPAVNGPVNTTAQFSALSRKVNFPLPAYNLVPGEGYMVAMVAGHSSTWLSPHY